MNIQPLYDRVVIKPLKQEEKTHTGIYIPETASKEKPQQGEIMAVGNGKMSKSGQLIPMTVKIGDVVLFSKYGPSEIKIEGQEYLIAEEKELLGIILT